MNELMEYLKRKQSLQAVIDEDRIRYRCQVLAEILLAVAEFQFSEDEIFPYGGKKVKPKYFDPISGATWSGRGKEPHWIKGKDRKDYQLTNPGC